jgi:hypothetical protein
MKWQWSSLSLLLFGSAGLGQEPTEKPAAVPALTLFDEDGRCDHRPSVFDGGGKENHAKSALAGTHGFDNFIGFMTDPLFNVDPRAVTELLPITGWSWFSTSPALPSGNVWLVPGAALTVALSERLSLGINQGGYAAANFDRNHPGLFRDRFGLLEDRAGFAGEREGWLNLGGFVQYTVIENVPDQFLLTAGLGWEAPIGSKAVFQGFGPAHLAPYVTAGKEIGEFHVLANAGYRFPTGSDGRGADLFYGCLHLDRKMFGWLYPVVEFNWIYHTAHVDLDLPTREGFIDLGTFESTGNLVALGAGVDAQGEPQQAGSGRGLYNEHRSPA